MKVTNLAAVEKQTVVMDGAQGVCKQVPISKQDGSPAFSFRVFTIAPNGHTPFHIHAAEHLNYIISGCGALVSETGEELGIGAGDFALVLPNEKHQYKNTSATEPLVLICAVPTEYE